MPRFLPLLALAFALPAGAQSVIVPQPGPVVSAHAVGGEFPAFTPAGVDASGAVGYRFGRGFEAAVLVGYGAAWDRDERFPYPAELHLGLDLGLVRGPARSPWRLSVVGLASIAGESTFVFPADGGPTELRDGPAVIELRGRASAVRYLRLLGDGPTGVRLGLGAFAAVRRLAGDATVYGAGGPDERVRTSDPVVEQRKGALVALPMSVALGDRAVLVLDPELRVGLDDLFFGVGDGQVTLRLNL